MHQRAGVGLTASIAFLSFLEEDAGKVWQCRQFGVSEFLFFVCFNHISRISAYS